MAKLVKQEKHGGTAELVFRYTDPNLPKQAERWLEVGRQGSQLGGDERNEFLWPRPVLVFGYDDRMTTPKGLQNIMLNTMAYAR